MRLVSGFRSPAPEKAGCFHDGSRNGVSGATNTQGPPPGTSTPTPGGHVPELQRHQPRSKPDTFDVPAGHTPYPSSPRNVPDDSECPTSEPAACGLREARGSDAPRGLRGFLAVAHRPRDPFGVRKSVLRVGAPCNGVFTDTELNGGRGRARGIRRRLDADPSRAAVGRGFGSREPAGASHGRIAEVAPRPAARRGGARSSEPRSRVPRPHAPPAHLSGTASSPWGHVAPTPWPCHFPSSSPPERPVAPPGTLPRTRVWSPQPHLPAWCSGS